jgi:hypothetical protein
MHGREHSSRTRSSWAIQAGFRWNAFRADAFLLIPALVRGLAALVLLGLCLHAPSFAQQDSSGQGRPDAPSASKSGKASPQHDARALFVILEKRSIFFPDIAATPGPLSPGEKFKLFLDDSISPHQLAESSLGSLIAQAADSPSGYGQGGEGYAKRFGASMARNASSGFFGTFLLASALHQDPRFFPQKNPSFRSSLKYSLWRLAVTRNDEGYDVPNWSGLSGPLLAEGLANAYWPEQDRSAGKTFERYGTDLGVRVGGNLLRDYWPVFFKKLAGSSRSPASRN